MKFTLKERKPEVGNIESFIWDPAEPIAWKAGQFFHYVLHHEPTDDRGSDRWFTIAAAPHEHYPMITTRFDADRSSSFKMALQALNIGDEIEISDLDGEFVVDDPNQSHVFIAGGIGITPFRSILLDLGHRGLPINVTLLYGNRDADLPYQTELEAIASRNPGLVIHPIIAPKRIDEATIRALVPDLVTPQFYVSGPKPMVLALSDTLKNIGVPADHIKQDKFPGYTIEEGNIDQSTAT